MLITFFFASALLALAACGRPPQPASIEAASGRAQLALRPTRPRDAISLYSFATAAASGQSPRSRNPLAWRDRAPAPAVSGRSAFPPWWQRLRSVVGLVIVCGFTGLVLAASVGVALLLAGFLLELAIT